MVMKAFGFKWQSRGIRFWEKMVPYSSHNEDIMTETSTSGNTDFVLYSNQGSDCPLDNRNLAVSSQHNDLLISSVAILGI